MRLGSRLKWSGLKNTNFFSFFLLKPVWKSNILPIKKNGNLIQGTPCGQSTLNVDNWTTSNVWLIHSNMSDNTITFFVNNGSYYRDKTSHALTDNIWYFVCGTCNSSSIRIYINGVQSGSTGTGINTGTILNNSNSVIQYGKDPRYGLGSGRFFNSLIGICYVYNRALSASEILQNYNSTKGRYGLWVTDTDHE